MKATMKRVMGVMLAMVMLLGLVPFSALATEDTRTEITAVVATSDMKAPQFGDAVVTAYAFTFTEGTVCSVPASMGHWLKKDGDGWQRYDGAYFSEGTYCYSNQLRINSPNGERYKFAETVDITIDGKKWTHNTLYDYGTYSYGYMQSPEFTVDWELLPLSFTDSTKFDIKKNYAGIDIQSYSVADAVFGGVGPYTFSKTSGPEWVNVAADGTVSGTPTAVGENADLVIRVTDNAGTYQEITVSVDATRMDPALREKVDTVVGTSNIGVPAYGDAVVTAYTFIFTEGTFCNVPASMGFWEKKNGEVWERYNSVTFVEGTYRYSNQLRIDSPYGETHQFAETVDITIDGESWTHGTMNNYEGYCYGYMTSAEFVIELPPVPELLFIDSDAYDIPTGYANKPMQSISVAEAVSGGVAPYAYSIVSGPTWLVIDENGVLSGTPTAQAASTTAVLQVTDAEESFKTITIQVGRVYKDPVARTPISTITATSNIETPIFGGQVKNVSFTVTAGDGVRFGGGSVVGWYKKLNDVEMEKYEEETFVAGTYVYIGAIYIDGEEGHEYVLAESLTVTVDGKEWLCDECQIDNDSSSVLVGCVFEVAPELMFEDSEGYDIPAGNISVPMQPISVAAAVSGGVAPYAYSIVSGPSWLTIDENGVLSGTPVAVADETFVTLRVTDAQDVYKEITISVGQILAKNGWEPEGGKWAYYKDGVKQTNCWMKDSVGWCYLGEDGYCVTNCWKRDSHGWCYLNADGRMATNCWVQDSVGWCYLGADGYAVTNCWKKDSHGWCYLNANGSMVKNNWVQDGGKWYFLDANGYMIANRWKKDSKGWVYLGANGAMVTNAWVRDSVGWCYVGADGYAVTNCWKRDSVGWCYLNANGSMTKNNWVLDGGKWYYLDGNGYMVANKTLTIGGKRYNFNASGVCTNP